MVTEKINNALLARYRLGNALIWLGVLVWFPFIALRIAGEKPSLFWFLPFHLASVIGGSRLRALARKELGVLPGKKSRVQKLGHALIFAGILVWAPYFYLKATQQPVDVMDYLPYHLVGVLGGVMALVTNQIMRQRVAINERNL
jgi:peptidoglycan/LPS O-acetylase OafA/YrhL